MKPIINFFIYLSSLIFLATAQDEMDGRIVGGISVKVNTYPWFTMLGFNWFGSFWRQKCAGALVSSQWVLTAAHCINDRIRDDGAVIVGAFVKEPYIEEDNGGQYNEKMYVKTVFEHPEYDSKTEDNDFALLRLHGRSIITPVALDSESLSESYTTGYSSLWAVGHGHTKENGFESDDLQHVNLNYVSNDDCTTSYDYNERYITSTMMCAWGSGKDACQGDSGGPLYDSANKVIVGVVSWGVGCARETYPGVYARVSSQYDWIKKTICDNSDDPPTWCVDDEPSTCKDSSLRFRVVLNGKYRFRDCKWVANKPNRCKQSGVKALCPLTCGKCNTCSDTSTVFKIVRVSDGRKVNRQCSWANNWRCNNTSGLSEACAETCGKCP